MSGKTTAFDNEKRVDIQATCIKILRYLALFAGVLVVTTVLFYLIKPYYTFWNRKGAVAQAFGVAALLIIAVFAAYMKVRGELDAELSLKLLLACGFVLRLTYMLYTPVSVRQQDTYNRALTGHEAYAWIVYTTGKLPATNDYQFYHPPLNAFVQAAFMKVTNALTQLLQNVFGLGDVIPSQYLSEMPKVTDRYYVGLTEYRYYLYSTTEILAVLWSFITMIALVKIVRLFGLESYTMVGISAILIFFPRHIQFAGQVNNDSIAYMFQILAIYYCLKWWKRGKKLHHLLLCSLAIGLGMMSKISTAIISVPIGCVFVYEFMLAIERTFAQNPAVLSADGKGGERDSDIPLWKLCVHYVIFLCICAPIGLWFQVYAYKKFNQPLGFVFSNLNTALLTTHHNWFERLFITLDPSEYFGTLYCMPFCTVKNGVITEYNNYNLFLYSLRSSLFGEFTYKGGEAFSATAFVCALVAAASLFASLIYCAVLYFKGGRKITATKSELKNMAFIFVIVQTMVISEFCFYVKMPYACTQDFRYIMPMILGVTMTYYYANRRVKAANTNFGNVLSFITTASMVSMLIMTTLFYCVCSV